MTDDQMTNPQRLAEWIMATGRKRLWVAQQCGVDAARVTEWCKGDAAPGRSPAVKLEELTEGAVKAGEW